MSQILSRFKQVELHRNEFMPAMDLILWTYPVSFTLIIGLIISGIYKESGAYKLALNYKERPNAVVCPF